MNVTAGYLNQLRPQLSDRDLEIIRQVGRFKLMTGSQLERLFFAHCSDISRARNRQAVLRRLTDFQVLTRVGQRRVGGWAHGSASFVYTLDIAGHHLAGSAGARPRRSYSWYEPTVNHFLATAEVYVLLVEASRMGQLTLLDFQAEPNCWRTFAQRTLKPDAFAEIGLVRPDGRRVKGGFFIEVDRANQYGAKIAGKLPRYLEYYQHERLAGATGLPRRVVFLAPDAGRVDYLNRLVASQPDAGQRFSVGLLDDVVSALLGT
ncbi:replication-relaxation family protein [Kitasatospora sp. NPDC050463]|uniref:replication-relaxation family protein n=1 Tax=Kitasatospora sp. NPDC050463 TaxID=3155786 RepID=UPI0033CE7FE8